MTACALLYGSAHGQEFLPTPQTQFPQAQFDPYAEIPLADEQAGAPMTRSIIESAPNVQSWPEPFAGNHSVPFSLADRGPLDRLHHPILREDLKINGAQSCAASNCHGGPRPGISQPTASRGMEYQIWVEDDPHAQSWRTICSDESVAMMQRLKIMEGDQIVDPVGFDNCLACHNSVKRYREPRREHPGHASLSRPAKPALVRAAGHRSGHPEGGDMDSFLREGVGCAGCHGPSEL